MEKNADLMIFRHENDLRLLEFTYLCKREVKWTLSQTLTVTDTQIGLSGKGTSSVITNSKQTVKEQEKLKKEGKCPACRGVGKSPDGQYECTSCKGTGKYP